MANIDSSFLILADNGETTVTLPALGGEYWGTFGNPGGEPLGVDGDDALLTGDEGGVGVFGGEGQGLGFALGVVLGELGAPDELQFLPLN